MNLKTMEKKLVVLLGQENSYDKSCFLCRNGTTTARTHEHSRACDTVGTTLEDYLEAGGCRLKVDEIQMIAIETGQKLTDEQVDKIIEIIRRNSFGYLVYFQRDNCKQIEIEDFNRIKPYQFKNALLSAKKDIYIKNF